MNAPTNNIDPVQPAQLEKADLGWKFFATGKFSAIQRSRVPRDPISCHTKSFFHGCIISCHTKYFSWMHNAVMSCLISHINHLPNMLVSDSPDSAANKDKMSKIITNGGYNFLIE